MLELKERLESLKDFEFEVELSKEDTLVIKDFLFWDNTQNGYSHSADVEIYRYGDGYGIDFSDGYFPKYCDNIETTVNEIFIRL